MTKALFLPDTPQTLGEALSQRDTSLWPWVKVWLLRLLLTLLCAGVGVVVFFVFGNPWLPLLIVLLGIAFGAYLQPKTNWKRHTLIASDTQHFLQHLKLADKTAVFDGSNIYHFGLKLGHGAIPLYALVDRLRAEGYRIVCFFDANIYFTLRDNEAFQNKTQKFSPLILKQVFDLNPDEVYVVPSGFQADGFILETLSLLPISFAVTNDRYLDFEDRYDFLKTQKDWRKSVRAKDGTLHLFQHCLKPPIRL